MGIIEQAARRLEELRRSGIVLHSPVLEGLHREAPAAAFRREVPSAALHGEGPAAPLHNVAPAAKPMVVKTSRQVAIDLNRLASMGYVTPDRSRSAIANEFRVIKRPLMTNVQGRSAAPVTHANRLMVTSSVPGEGKTFVSINLAISLAMELDRTVLLVDADVSRPSVLDRLGLPASKGLLDLLLTPSLDMSECLLRTNIDKLTLLPAGSPHPRSTELLASDAMSSLVQETAARYPDRILVFDAPPLLPSTESRVLATHMGQVILVVESGRTPHRTVHQALATVEACPVVMPLLNKTSRSDVGSYYGYGSAEE